MTKSFCALPWKEIATSPSGTVRLCCSSISSLSHSRYKDGTLAKVAPNLQEAWNSDSFKEIRQKMLRGEKVAACENCYQQEEAGLKSSRLEWNQKHSELQLSSLSDEVSLSNVEQLDLRLGNLCNLKCRMCNPYSSSSWVSEWNQLKDFFPSLTPNEISRLKNNSWAEDPEVWNQLQPLFKNLKRVYLTGGEPFLSPFNKKFLRYCVDHNFAANIEIRYNTNGTIWDEELPSLWKSFRKVKIKFSVDGLRELNSYIRHPSRWDRVLRNINRATELQSVQSLEVSIACAVQAYNIFQIPDLLQFFSDKKIPVFLDVVHQPSFLSVQVLDEAQALRAKEALTKVQDFPGVTGIMNLLDSRKKSEWDTFKSYTRKMDLLRNEDIASIVPELGIVRC